MDEDDIAGFMSAFASAAEPVDVHFLWRPLLSDESVLECAFNGRAQAMITHNLKHFMPVFGALGIAIVTPGTFLKGMST